MRINWPLVSALQFAVIAVFVGILLIDDGARDALMARLAPATSHSIAGKASGKPYPASWQSAQELIESDHRFLDSLLRGQMASAQPKLEPAEFRHLIGVPKECHDDPESTTHLTPLADEPASGIPLQAVSTEIHCGAAVLRAEGLLYLAGGAQPSGGLLIAIHGTASSPEQIFGLETDEHFDADDYHHNFALRAAKAGFSVYAPRIVTDPHLEPASVFNKNRNELDRRAEALGAKLVGMEVFAISETVSEIRKLDELKNKKTGVYGISLGGMTAFYLAALDQDIDAVVVSQWAEQRGPKLASRNHESAMWRYEQADYTIFRDYVTRLSDELVVKSLIVPRPLMYEVGSEDERSKMVRLLFQKLLSFYPPDARADSRLCLAVGPGGHEIFFDQAIRFFEYWLSESGTSNPAAGGDTGVRAGDQSQEARNFCS